MKQCSLSKCFSPHAHTGRRPCLIFEGEITGTTVRTTPSPTFHLARLRPLLYSSAQIFQKAAECQQQKAEENSSSHSLCLAFMNGFIISRSIPVVHYRTALLTLTGRGPGCYRACNPKQGKNDCYKHVYRPITFSCHTFFRAFPKTAKTKMKSQKSAFP